MMPYKGPFPPKLLCEGHMGSTHFTYVDQSRNVEIAIVRVVALEEIRENRYKVYCRSEGIPKPGNISIQKFDIVQTFETRIGVEKFIHDWWEHAWKKVLVVGVTSDRVDRRLMTLDGTVRVLIQALYGQMDQLPEFQVLGFQNGMIDPINQVADFVRLRRSMQQADFSGRTWWEEVCEGMKDSNLPEEIRVEKKKFRKLRL